VRRPTEQANLLLGVAGLPATDARRATLVVLNSVLGGGMSSRLFQEVREKRGMAYSVYSFAASYADAGLMGLYAGCSPKNATAVAELMMAEFRRLASDGITDEELSRAQGQLGGASALALEDSDTRMTRLGRSELTFGEFSDLDETLRRIAGVSVDDVRALAADLVARPLSVAAVGALDDHAFDGLVEPSAAA
jgi:predicted Zn-dependent peptidase